MMTHPLPTSMIAPGQRRKAPRGGILQIMVTRACDLSCHHCTQGSNLAGKPVMMTPDQFDQACASLQGYFGVVGMFGGNPCMHPQFGELCKIMRARIPFEQRGIWTNNLKGNGAHARVTFNPAVSNLNVHLSTTAYDEFYETWPESRRNLKGNDLDSMHSSPWVSMIDLGIPEEERWQLIGQCDINQYWSALIGVIHGELRAYFCEVAYSQAVLHADNPDWAGSGAPQPLTGLPVEPGWWKLPMSAFDAQVRLHCHHCGIPMRRQGQLAIAGEREEFSFTHSFLARPKTRSRPVQIVESIGMVRSQEPATNYLPHTTPGF